MPPTETTMDGIARRLVERARRVVAEAVRSAFAAGRIPVRTIVGAPGDDGVPVVMCAGARIDAMPRTLAELAAQREAGPIDLWIWNNRRAEHARLLEALRDAGPSGALRSVSVVRSPFNLGSIARFYLARRLWLRGRRGHFVVIDDDFVLPDDLVAVALGHRVANGAAGFWAWTVEGSYWERRRAQPGDRIDHLGPAGMIADLDMLADPGFFHAVPRGDWLMDDIWFSHWALSHGHPLARLPIEIPTVEDDKNLYPMQVEAKIEFYERMRRSRA